MDSGGYFLFALGSIINTSHLYLLEWKYMEKKLKHKTIECYEEYFGKPLKDIISSKVKTDKNGQIIDPQKEIDWGKDVGEEIIK